MLGGEAAVGTPTDSERLLDALYQEALARPTKDAERIRCSTSLADAAGVLRADADDADKLLQVGLAPVPAATPIQPELAAWTSVCRVVLNLHETITRY